MRRSLMSASTLFTVNTSSGTELWSSDGTQNIQLAIGLSSKVVEVGDSAYFATSSGIWKTDGLTTEQVQPADGARNLVVSASGSLYFIAQPPPPPPPSEWDPYPPVLTGAPQLFE